MRPLESTYPDYYKLYIPLAPERDVVSALQNNLEEIKSFISAIPSEKHDFSYAANKWTVKQVIGHLTDTERIMAYRALRFARKDPQQPLFFDEDHYALNSNATSRNMDDLTSELSTVRNATLSLFKSFTDELLLQKGSTTIGETTVLAVGFMIAGHAKHHLNVVKERYLQRV